MYFEELVEKISPKLKRIAHRLNGRYTFFNEEDLYQEALLHLWISFKDGRLSDKTDSFILQGCFFYLKNLIRKTVDKVPILSLDGYMDDEAKEPLEEFLSSREFDQAGYLDSELVMDRLRENGLTDREMQIISFYIEGLTVREIGKRLDISHVMVVKLRNGIKEKCEKLKKEFFDRGYHHTN